MIGKGYKMKIFKKIKKSNGRRQIYFCGIKVLSYKRKKFQLPASLISCQILNYQELIQKGTKFPHLLGIVISRGATIGRNNVIFQNVTIGAKFAPTLDKKYYPIIGDNCRIYAGAVVIGPIKIGNNAVIGANSVVVKDVPENAIVAGVPAKIIRYREKDENV